MATESSEIETQRIIAETAKLRAETDKMRAEQEKLFMEALKFRRESAWYPFVAGAGLVAGTITATLAIVKYFH